MILGIDASNIRAGGGLTHLRELLGAADPAAHGFSRVVVWGGRKIIDALQPRPWLDARHEPVLDRSIAHRVAWQHFSLRRLSRAERCDVLFVPGGQFAEGLPAVVTLNQNLLPFEWRELLRYSRSPIGLRLAMLRWGQARSFRRAAGVIFLTHHARRRVTEVTGALSGKTAVIPHGFSEQFIMPPRPQLPLSQFSVKDPLRIVYVSIVDLYKHQWHVADAVAQLRRENLPVTLDLIGPAYGPALARLKKVMRRVDAAGEFIFYRGPVPHSELPRRYHDAHMFVFASSCESFGQIVTEAMAAGLPMACSRKSAMPELLENGAEYFDPETPSEIADALRRLAQSAELRATVAALSFELAKAFSWNRCARETFTLLAEVGGGVQ